MVPRTEYAPFGGKRMQKAAARARSVNAARRMLQACVGRRVMKKVRRDDPRFGDSLHHLSTATTLMEALDNPKLIRNGLSNEGVRLVCERLAGELQRSAEMTLGEEISSLFGDRPSDRGVMLRLGLSGLEPMTLQEAGERVGVTRERVRQKQEQLFTMFERTKPYLPALDRGLKAVEESLSNKVDSIQAMEQRLRVAGIL